MSLIPPGRFLTVEGIEGVGKTTQVARLSQSLSGRGIAHVVTREPGGTPLAERIRDVVLGDSRGESLPPTAELLLMFAARAVHLTNLVEPNLRAGRWVVCDRFIDATYAYQGGGRGVSTEHIRQLEVMVLGARRPDLTVLLDAPVEQALQRARQRNAGAAADRFESERAEFFERVRSAYLARAAAEPARIAIVDASQSVDEVAAQILAVSGSAFMDILSADSLPWLNSAQQRLRAAFAAQRLPHSLLLLSAPGLGAEQLANWITALALCESTGRRPCGVCASCQLLRSDSHPDSHVVRVEEDAQQIKVDQVRGLIESLALKSYRGGYKVGVIEGAELLNANGANAFLKTLEEPTANTVLVLIARPDPPPAGDHRQPLFAPEPVPAADRVRDRVAGSARGRLGPALVGGGSRPGRRRAAAGAGTGCGGSSRAGCRDAGVLEAAGGRFGGCDLACRALDAVRCRTAPGLA